VPAAQRAALHTQWLGSPDSSTGLGAVIAGCFHPAKEVGSSGVWVAPGTCAGALRSLALANAAGEGAIVLYRAALFARREADAGRLLGETSHEEADEVDMYTVTSTLGTTVFIRRSVVEPLQPKSCSEYAEGSLHFTEVPVGLTRLWLDQMAAEEQRVRDGGPRKPWPVPVQASRGEAWPRRYAFQVVGSHQHPMLHAICSSPSVCELHGPSGASSTSGEATVDVGTLLQLVQARSSQK
jgi:hypothetical protein